MNRLLACLFGSNLKASPEEFLQALDGKISRMDPLLLQVSLDKYRFCTQKIGRLTQGIEVYILDHFRTEDGLLLEITGIK